MMRTTTLLATIATLAFGATLAVPTAAVAGRRAALEGELERRFVSAVESAIDVEGTEVRVSGLKASTAELLRKSSRIESFELTQTRRPVGRVSARVIFTSGKTLATAWVYAKVDATVPVWVVSTPIERGAPIHRAVHVERRDAARLPHGALTADRSLMGRIAARRLMRGAPLTASALTTPMLVRRGDQVQVSVKVGAVRIAASGTAMRNGRIGQRIPVRVRQGRIIQAAVSGPRRVEVER